MKGTGCAESLESVQGLVFFMVFPQNQLDVFGIHILKIAGHRHGLAQQIDEMTWRRRVQN